MPCVNQLTLLMWANPAVAPLAHVAVLAKNLKARWITMLAEPQIEIVAIVSFRYLASMFRAVSVNVVNREKHNFSFSTAGAFCPAISSEGFRAQLASIDEASASGDVVTRAAFECVRFALSCTAIYASIAILPYFVVGFSFRLVPFFAVHFSPIHTDVFRIDVPIV